MKKVVFSLSIAVFALTAFVSPAMAEEESYTYVEFSGMLIEIGSTDVPTTLIVRENDSQVDYTVNIDENTILGQRRDQLTRLEDWIPGDQITVRGNQNDNTGVVTANVAANRSIVTTSHLGLNGWIEEVDVANGIVKVQWAGQIYTVTIDQDTHIVAGLINPASIDDLVIGDRVRGRLVRNIDTGELKSKIIIVLRRGDDLFMKVRTWVTDVELISIESETVPTTITAEILPNPALREGDVNNLIGVEGDIITINITDDSKMVRRFFGLTDLTEFLPGDKLAIVGRANDDGTINAKVVKNNSIWMTTTKGYIADITEINIAENYFNAAWLGRDYRVDIDNDTHIVRYDINPASLSDLQVGDRIKVRGTKHFSLNIIDALEIVVK